MSAVLALHGASVDLGGRQALDGVTISVVRGEVLGVVGPNGGGKTTLLRAVLGLAKLSSGQALLFGEAVRTLDDSRRASLAAYMPQDRRVGWNLPAWSIAALGRPDLPPGRAKPAALAALAEVGLANLAERGILDMSGGERARVLLARMIATGAPALVADEPVAGLDPDAQMLVMEVLRARASQGAAVMVSLHDLTLAARHCDRIAVMAGGRLLAVGAPSEALSPEILTRAFGLRGRLEPTEFGPIMVATRI